MILPLIFISATSTVTISAEERSAAALEKIEQAASRMATAAEKMAGQTPAAKAEEKKAEPSPWSGTIGLGLIWLAGNSESLTFSGNATAQLKLEDWIFSAKANGSYGQTQIAGTATDPQVSALNAAGQVRGDRRFTEAVTGYIAGGLETDHVKSIDYRAFAEGGASITWFEDKKEDFILASLRTDLGLRYTFEEQFQYYPVEMDIEDPDAEKLLAPRLGVVFRYAVSENLIFTEDVEVLPNILKESRVLLNSTSKLSVRLTSILSFAVALGIKHDTRPPPSVAPAPPTEKTDSSLTASLEAAF